MINCSLCPLGMGQEVISLGCSKEDVEIGARKSFRSFWIVKHENSLLREAVVPSSQEAEHMRQRDTKFCLSCFIIVLSSSEGEWAAWTPDVSSQHLLHSLKGRHLHSLAVVMGTWGGRARAKHSLCKCPCRTFHAPGMIQFYSACPTKARGSLCIRQCHISIQHCKPFYFCR